MSNSPDLLCLTREAIPAVARIAATLANANDASDQTTTSLVKLSVCLYIFANEVDHGSSPNGRDQQCKIHAVLEEVEKALTWPKNKRLEQLLTLHAIATAKEQKTRKPFFQRLLRRSNQHATVHASLRKYLVYDPELKSLLSLTREFSAVDVANVTHGESFGSYSIFATKWDDIPVHPQRVNTELHNVLDLHINCCPCRHSTRLRLKPSEMQVNDMFGFEFLFSASSPPLPSTCPIGWREVRILIPRRDPLKKQVKILNLAPHGPLQTTFNTPFEVIRPGKFCELLNESNGCIPCLRIDNPTLGKLGGETFPTPRVEVEPVESTPLSNALRLRRMSRRNKCVFAFTLARSVWQYYESNWMKLPWTHEDIHLLDDKNAASAEANDAYRTWRPYLSTSFDNPGQEILEYCNAEAVMHRYPKVLALGILLIEILQGSTVVPRSGNISFDPQGVNELYISGWIACRGILEDEETYPAYAHAVEACLDSHLFAGVPCSSETNEGLEERRIILYQRVVVPLKKLLEGTGWSYKLDENKKEFLPQPTEDPSISHSTCTMPADSAAALRPEEFTQPYVDGRLQRLDEAASEAGFLGQLRTHSPEAWLKRFERVSRYVKSTTKGNTPVRIAVLDTGCDLDASVFRVSGTKQSTIDRWKDMAGTEKMPIDKDPGKHGTRIVSVLLRIAPNAEIFVARVASDKETLQKSHRHITDAIIYAAKYWSVDIISMSFGFEQEIDVIRHAIDEAQAIKDQSIILLAAAGNDGGNSSELFPAWLSSVISIRGTDHSGDFISSFNPSNHDFNSGQPAYGTLGVNVPCSWPSESASEEMTGCSIATPIAAAIVAVIINCASESDQKLLRTQKAILTVFKRMAAERSNGLWYLAPWQLVHTDDQEGRKSFLNGAIQKLPRRH